MESTRSLEIKVGLFVLAGLALIATGIVLFGRFGELISPRYYVTVEFPNASGLVRGSTVFYAGAPIGRVDSNAEVIKEGTAVELSVWIYNNVKIRKDSRWVIGSSGLLGDRFIDVQPRPGSDADLLVGGERIEGTRVAGVADLAETAAPLIEQATLIVTDINKMVKQFRKDVFTEESTAELRDALDKFKSILGRIDQVVNEDDVEASSQQIKSILAAADDILNQAQSGKGMLGQLLYNKELSADIQAFVANIRKNGVLFYKDSANEQEDERRRSSSSISPRDSR